MGPHETKIVGNPENQIAIHEQVPLHSTTVDTVIDEESVTELILPNFTNQKLDTPCIAKGEEQ